MSTDNSQVRWTEVKGKIKLKWAKLADADVDSFKDNMHLISDKVQKAYGYTKDKADQEYAEFKKTLEPTVAPVDKAKSN